MNRRHSGPGAVAGDGNAHWIGAQLGGMCRGPASRIETIVDARREFVLGRKTIIDRGDDASRTGAQIAAHPIVGIQAAQHETAAMKEHQQREWPSAVRRIDADTQSSARPVDGPLADLGDFGRGRHQGDARLVLRARHIDRQRVCRGHAGALVQQGLDLGIDGHRSPVAAATTAPRSPSGPLGPAESDPTLAPDPCRAACNPCRRTPGRR